MVSLEDVFMALYTEITVPLPKDTGYDIKSGNNLNRYIYLRTYRENKKLKHDVLFIGRHIKDPETNIDCLIPNDNYFNHYNIALPIGENIVSKGPGRAKKINKNSTYNELDENSKLGFGLGIAIFAIAKQLHLQKILEKIFNPQLAIKIIGIAMYYLEKENAGLTDIEFFTTKQMCFTDKILTPDIAYEVFKNISEEQRANFFKLWTRLNKKGDIACYDVTSFSTYSTDLTGSEYGYNRDHEKLPQFNIGMFTNLRTHIPLAYECYNGSINDFTNFPYVIDKAKSWGLDKNILIVQDGGFADIKTLDFVIESGYDLLVGMPIDKTPKEWNIKNKLKKWRTNPSESDLESLSKYNFGTNTISGNESNIELSEKTKGRLFMYWDLDSDNLNRSSMTTSIQAQKEQLKAKETISKQAALKYKKYFDIKINEDQTFSYSINQKKVKEKLMLCGCFALFCSQSNLKLEDGLFIYRKKDCVEKRFDDLKNDLMCERIRSHKRETCDGKIFVLFISLILMTELRNKLQSWITQHKSSLQACINMLEDIECTKRNEQWILHKSLTKPQKELVQLLELPMYTIDLKRG